jgi:membrane protein YqaA with SNARE-associated domain
MNFESLGVLGLFISSFISSTIAPGGSEAVLAYLVTQNTTPIIELITVATVGNTLGALTTWWLGLWTAKKYPPSHFDKTEQQKSLNIVRRWGCWALLFSWLPIIGDGLCFAAGWLKLSPLFSLLTILLGKALRYMAVAYAFV